LAVDGGYIFAPTANDVSSGYAEAGRIDTAPATPAPARKSWAQDVFSFPETTGSSAPAKPAEEKPKIGPKEPPPGQSDGKVMSIDGPRQLSAGERAVLERLQERRQELDARAREIEIRENLLKAAEKRLEVRASEIKGLEAGGSDTQKREADAARFKSSVVMYENMKAKDAAKIFDRLDMRILIEVASAFNPRKMSDVMAQMSPEVAEKLTVELANRAGTRLLSTPELPKIEGKPNGT
jgi:flagellar motility protein MotE (MotC chaperone)